MLRVDDRDVAMTVRFAAATVPQRATASTPENLKPSAFPVAVCEAPLPAGSRRAKVDGVRLPVPKREVRRIVVIGDTGCRMKASDHAYQPCNDRAKFPFARIAARAAKWGPDLVVHVGDYEYRENPCPAAETGCAGSVWGYGGDAWAADFFTPAAPLLAAAPIAPARGNHESYARAGQGWWRFLDGHPAAAAHDCDDLANDRAGDWSPPYAVPLGGGAQLILLDLSAAGDKAIPADDWRAVAFEATYQTMVTLAAAARSSITVDHYPILGFAASNKGGESKLLPGNLGVQSVFGTDGPRQLPPASTSCCRGPAEPVHHRLFGDARGRRAAARTSAAGGRACAGGGSRELRVVDRRLRLHDPRTDRPRGVAGDRPRRPWPSGQPLHDHWHAVAVRQGAGLTGHP